MTVHKNAQPFSTILPKYFFVRMYDLIFVGLLRFCFAVF